MAEYLVTWEIEIAADNETKAVDIALEIQRDPNSKALHFTVERLPKRNKEPITRYTKED